MLFGIVTSLISVSGSYAGLMVLRLLLGIGEAVMTTGLLYLNLWYRRDELAWRSGKLNIMCLSDESDGY